MPGPRPLHYRPLIFHPVGEGFIPPGPFAPPPTSAGRRGRRPLHIPQDFAQLQTGTAARGLAAPACQKITFNRPRMCRGDHWSPVNLPQQRIFRNDFLTKQTGTGEQCSPLQEFFDSLRRPEVWPPYTLPP